MWIIAHTHTRTHAHTHTYPLFFGAPWVLPGDSHWGEFIFALHKYNGSSGNPPFHHVGSGPPSLSTSFTYSFTTSVDATTIQTQPSEMIEVLNPSPFNASSRVRCQIAKIMFQNIPELYLRCSRDLISTLYCHWVKNHVKKIMFFWTGRLNWLMSG